MYDVIVIGGGPAGVSAAIYASRKQLKTAIFSDAFGGQSAVSAGVENWIGEVSIPGWQLAQKLETHLKAQEGMVVKQERVVSLDRTDNGFVVTAESGAYESRAVIVASGARHRHLEVPGEDTFAGKGVAYCSTCDAPFFKGKTVAVVGGGNSGLEAVEDLLPYASKIMLLSLSGELRGDEITRDKILADDRVSVMYHAKTTEILGEHRVEGLRYEQGETRESIDILVDGVFVEVGMIPNGDIVKHLIELTPYGEIPVDPKTFATTVPGLYAAGDVTDMPYRQNNISSGQGVVAALAAYDFLRKQ